MAGRFKLHPNGAGDSLGDAVVTQKPLYVSGNIWYVHNSTGTDAASPAGQNRNKPLATLAQAVTNAANDDIIVLMDGHTETVTAVQTVNKRLVIAGAGLSSGKPTAKLTVNAAAASLLSFTAEYCQLRNVWIEENAMANSSPKINVAANHFRMVGCYVEANGNDDATCLQLNTGATYCSLESTTFVSTSTSSASQPESAIKTAGSGVTQLEMQDVTLDGGTVGWSNRYALDDESALLTRIKAHGLSLLNGSNCSFSDAVGWVSLGTVTGGSVVESAAFHHYPNGIGGASGDVLTSEKPLLVSGNIWYVHSPSGADAGGTVGQSREAPLATLAQAVTNAANDDIIVLMDGHAETVTAAQTLSKRLTLVGDGSVGGQPSAQFTLNAVAATLITVSTDSVEIRNLKFNANAQGSFSPKISVTAGHFRMVGCRLEGNASDVVAVLSLGTGSDNARIQNATFLSVSASGSTQPISAISGGTLSGIELEGTVLSGGEIGWSSLYPVDLGNQTAFRSLGCSFLFGADISLGATSTGWITMPTTTGSVRFHCG